MLRAAFRLQVAKPAAKYIAEYTDWFACVVDYDTVAFVVLVIGLGMLGI